MIDFTAKTYRNLLRTQLDRVPDSLDKREGSLIQTAVGAGAYALEEFYLELDQVQRGAYLQTAVGQDLDYLAVLANVQRYPASPAVRLGSRWGPDNSRCSARPPAPLEIGIPGLSCPLPTSRA